MGGPQFLELSKRLRGTPWLFVLGVQAAAYAALNYPSFQIDGFPLGLPTIGRRYFLSEWVAIAFLVLPWFFLLEKRAAAAAACFWVGTLAAVNYLKLRTLGTPLISADFFFLGQSKLISSYSPVVTALVLYGLPLLVLLTLAYQVRRLVRREFAFSRFNQMVIGLWLISFGWVCLLTLPQPAFHEARNKILDMHLRSRWKEKAVPREFGFATSLLFGASNFYMERPAGFSLEDSRRAIDIPRSPELVEGAPRSLVVVLLESFVDPLVLGATLADDPIPRLRRFMAPPGQQQVRVDGYGSGTANTCFEVLTGVPLKQVPHHRHPYLTGIRQPLHSIVRTFRRAGYETIGIHNFKSWSWRRNVVWPWLGFERMRFLPDLPPVAVNAVGWPVSDAGLFEAVLREAQSAQGLKFIFAVSVATHGPFKSLQSYFERLRRLDDEAGALFEALENKNIPFVALGDHFPALQFKGAKIDKHVTPVLLSRPLRARRIWQQGTVPAYCLASELTSLAGLSPDGVTAFFSGNCLGGQRELASAPSASLRQNVVYDFLRSGLGLTEKEAACASCR